MSRIVSCLCPTYNRAPTHLHLLGEAVESFVRQKLPPGVVAELVILNDAGGQELRCTVPGVRVLNAPGRYTSLGAKFNALVNYAQGDLLLPWEDDDISLPRRIAQAVEWIERGHAFFNPRQTWFLHDGKLSKDHSHGVCHNASAFTREAWRICGGYVHVSGNQDALMNGALFRVFGVPRPVYDPRQWQYIYRWGVSPCHLSGMADGPPDEPHALHYQRVGQEPIAAGTFTIAPRWRRDYVRLCQEACA